MIMKPFTNEILPQGYKMTELGPLPEEWEVIRLGEVCKVDWGNTSLTKKLYTANGYPAFSAAGNDGFLDFYEHDGEAVILSAIGARSGKCFYASGKWTAIKNTIVIKSNNETKINLLFLYFFVNNENYWHKSGSGQPFISIGVAQKQKLPLPPLPEQQKMAAVLSAVQEAKEKTRAVIDATKALKKSMMKHLFTYGPVSPEEAANVPLKETEIGKVSEEWEVVKLGEVTDFSKKPRDLDANIFEKIPFIPMEVIPIDKIYIKDYVMKKPTEISSGVYCEKGDILLPKITPCFENDKQGIVEDIPSDFAFATTEVYPIKPKKDFLDKLFLFYFLIRPDIRKDISEKMQGTTGRRRVPKNTVVNILFPLPPLPVQQKIASILSAIDEKIQAEETKEKALEDLFRSLLSHLMNGKIRVKDLVIGD